MINIRTVHIGNFALPQENRVYSLKSYTKFYNELVNNGNVDKLSIFAGYIIPGETGFEFSHEEMISSEINFTLSKGNTPTTRLFKFLYNNIVLFSKLTIYSLTKAHYFVFLPSPIGVWSILIVTLLNRKKTLGIYLGGYYKNEQAFEHRSGYIKKKIKKAAAWIVEKLVSYAIRMSDYIITPSYELHFKYNSSGKIYLTPPLMNVDEHDLQMSFHGRIQILFHPELCILQKLTIYQHSHY